MECPYFDPRPCRQTSTAERPPGEARDAIADGVGQKAITRTHKEPIAGRIPRGMAEKSQVEITYPTFRAGLPTTFTSLSRRTYLAAIFFGSVRAVRS